MGASLLDESFVVFDRPIKDIISNRLLLSSLYFLFPLAVIGSKPRALYLLGKCSTMELQTSDLLIYYIF